MCESSASLEGHEVCVCVMCILYVLCVYPWSYIAVKSGIKMICLGLSIARLR